MRWLVLAERRHGGEVYGFIAGTCEEHRFPALQAIHAQADAAMEQMFGGEEPEWPTGELLHPMDELERLVGHYGRFAMVAQRRRS